MAQSKFDIQNFSKYFFTKISNTNEASQNLNKIQKSTKYYM